MRAKTNTTAGKKRLWDITMANIQTVGNKSFVFAPMELLYADQRFQRVEESSRNKIGQLARNWNENKLDPLKGSIHPEEYCISIIDGYHRIKAGEIVGCTGMVVEIVQNLPTDPAERLIAEAELFATQTDEVDALTPVQKHKANVLRGVKENVIVEKLMAKYRISFKKNPSHGRVKIGELAGFTMALGIAKAGETMLDDVLAVLCGARWNLSNGGLGSNALHMVFNLLRLHPEHHDAIMAAMVELLIDVDPNQLYSLAHAKYPNRKERERILMYAETVICEKLGIPQIYNGGSINVVLGKMMA